MSDKDPSAHEQREKNQALLAEISELREEIRLLKARLRDKSMPASLPGVQRPETVYSGQKEKFKSGTYSGIDQGWKKARQND